jgi:uncharacterized delta-60 repeat protein
MSTLPKKFPGDQVCMTIRFAGLPALVLFAAAAAAAFFGQADTVDAGDDRVHLSRAGTAVNDSSLLDAGFGTGGIVKTRVGGGNAQAVALQPDGRIVVAGYASNGVNNDFALVRYTPSGDLDASFDGESDGNGIVLTAVGNSHDEAYGIALQPNGLIVVVGQTYDGVRSDFAIARFLPDGRLDRSFGTDGRQTIRAGTGNSLARSVALQPDGQIVAAGIAMNGVSFDAAVVRLMPDGSPDETFGAAAGQPGVVLTDVGPGHDQMQAVIVQPGGRIVVAGYYNGPASTDTLLLGYTTDGRLDGGFGVDGVARHSFSAADADEALAMAVRPDGKLVIAGCIRTPGVANDFLIAQFQENGTRDMTFGGDGFTTAPFGPGIDIGLGVALHPHGKIVAAGFGFNGQNYDFAASWMDEDGAPNPAFGQNGRTLTMIGTGVDTASAVAVQPDGKAVVVGRTVDTTSDFAVVRYRAETGTVAGRVLSPAGIAVRNVVVSLFGPGGEARTVTTGSFGTFRFDEVPAGLRYTLTARSRRYRFAPQAFDLTDSLVDFSFVGLQ